jgi:phospholipid/cholesterol/gamma-HCH transport system substrate-binding protein
METTAKYRLMGAFTLAAALGVFGFIYWLNHGGGLGERAAYQIRFMGPVPGLRPGATVQFNGIRVGEVTDLRLDTQNPQQVTATISIERATPMRADTKVTLDFQGLMGVTSIALKGGSAQSPTLGGTGVPTLVADASAGADLTATAREALRRLDGILADNSDALRGTIANLQTFTAALAKNSDRVDGIVAGLERMTGGGDAARGQIVSFDLTAPRTFPPLAEPVKGQIAVTEPTALMVLDTQRLIARFPSGGRAQLTGGGQWSDNLPKLVQARLIQTLENALSQTAVGRASDALTADRQLMVDIRSFDLVRSEPPVASVELAAKIVADNRVLNARTFTATAPAASAEAAATAQALDRAFGQAATDLALWARTVQSSAR